jgi:hypothetical protein
LYSDYLTAIFRFATTKHKNYSRYSTLSSISAIGAVPHSNKTKHRVHRQFVDSKTGKPVEAAD